MSSHLLRICDPRAYFDQFIIEEVYPDGRSIHNFRPVTVQMGVAPSVAGSSVARQGGATMICKVEPMLAVMSDAPVIVPHLKAAPEISQSVLEDLEDLVCQLVNQEAFISKESLKTGDGRLTWILHLNIMILHMDGFVMDALTTCVMGALMDLSLPEISLNLDVEASLELSKIVVGKTQKVLEIADVPVSCTYLIYDLPNSESKILCDPVADLYPIASCNVIIIAGNNSKLHKIIQRGACDPELLRKMVSMAFGRQKMVAESLMKARSRHLKEKKDVSSDIID
uniref:Ribosomal RNA-processing protein 43 n=1 Tax=Syphacia muris TaxID=451379 RepID=A0A0N5AH71_9BILA